MVRRIALGLACVGVFAGGAARAETGERRLAVRSQIQFDEQRGVGYTLSHTSGGGILLTGQGADLVFEKTSFGDGRFELRITSGADVVTFAVSATGTTVSRNGRTAALAALSAGTAGEDDFDRARAVRRYRQLAAALEASDEASPAAHGVLIGAAVVHALDGDPGAPYRIARRLASRRASSGLRQVALLAQDTTARTEDCWTSYEQRVNQAYRDFEDCQRSRQWYNYELVSYACSGVWMVRIEGYWFQYLKCSALF